jgi:small subunit ribosomal protein S6
MSRYEAVIIFDANLDEDGVKAQIQKIETFLTSRGVTREKHDIWGRRQLAYRMNKKDWGTYTLLIFSGSTSVVAELDRQLRINDSVLRHMVVTKDKFAPDLTPERKLDEGFSFVALDAPAASEEEFGGDARSESTL